jgi:hypothetical protein
LEGLARPLHYQLTSHTFQSFQQLLDKAIVLESMRRELEELKRKAATPGPYGSHTRPRFTSPLGAPFRQGGPSGGYGKQQQYQYQPQQYQQFQCTPQQFPHPGPQTPRPGYPQHRSMTPLGTPVRQVHLTPPRATLASSVERFGIMQMPVLRGTPRHPRAEPADAIDEEREPDPAEQQESGLWQGEPREY